MAASLDVHSATNRHNVVSVAGRAAEPAADRLGLSDHSLVLVCDVQSGLVMTNTSSTPGGMGTGHWSACGQRVAT